jgi:hypothetical protein
MAPLSRRVPLRLARPRTSLGLHDAPINAARSTGLDQPITQVGTGRICRSKTWRQKTFGLTLGQKSRPQNRRTALLQELAQK